MIITTPQGVRCAGHLRECDTGLACEKTVSKAKHLLRRRDAWAYDLGAVKQMREAGVSELIINEQDEGVVYRCTLETLLERGEHIDDGCGRQIALARRYWSHHAPGQLALALGVSL